MHTHANVVWFQYTGNKKDLLLVWRSANLFAYRYDLVTVPKLELTNHPFFITQSLLI